MEGDVENLEEFDTVEVLSLILAELIISIMKLLDLIQLNFSVEYKVNLIEALVWSIE